MSCSFLFVAVFRLLNKKKCCAHNLLYTFISCSYNTQLAIAHNNMYTFALNVSTSSHFLFIFFNAWNRTREDNDNRDHIHSIWTSSLKYNTTPHTFDVANWQQKVIVIQGLQLVHLFIPWATNRRQFSTSQISSLTLCMVWNATNKTCKILFIIQISHCCKACIISSPLYTTHHKTHKHEYTNDGTSMAY